MKRQYKIVDLAVEFTGYNLQRIDAYECFEPFESEFSTPDVSIVFQRDYDDMPQDNMRYSLHNELVWYCALEPESGDICFKILGNHDDGQVSVRYLGGTNRVIVGGDADYYIMIFALWLAYGVVALRSGVLSIHSSCVDYLGRAVMFLGESGTGKSTHSRLWLNNFLGASLLNDDSPFIRVTDDTVWVYGSPWSGKTVCYKQLRRELAGVVRLSQAPENHVVKHNNLKAFAAMYPSAPIALYSCEALGDMVCDVLSEVVARSGVWHLEALPDLDAALTSREAIYGIEK